MNLLLISTYPSSLKLWNKLGILSRELKPYEILAKDHKLNIKILTFGNNEDYQYQHLLKNIEVIPAFSRMKSLEKLFGKFIMSLFIPFFFKKIFQETDVIKHNQFWGSWIGYIAKIIYKKKLIIRNGYSYYRFQKEKGRSFFTKYLLKIFSILIFTKANKVIVTTRSMKSEFISEFKLNKESITIIPNYIDVDSFKRDSKIIKEKEILIIGRLTKQKNIDQLFKVISNCKYKINLIGDGNVDYYKILSKKYGLNVSYIKKVNNKQLSKYFNKCCLYIIYSLYEGNPKTLLEAMSCEMPVIGSDVVGIKELIFDQVNGVLVDLGDPKINNYINKIMENKKYRENLGERARKTILENNSLKTIVEKLLVTYYEKN